MSQYNTLRPTSATVAGSPSQRLGLPVHLPYNRVGHFIAQPHGQASGVSRPVSGPFRPICPPNAKKPLPSRAGAHPLILGQLLSTSKPSRDNGNCPHSIGGSPARAWSSMPTSRQAPSLAAVSAGCLSLLLQGQQKMSTVF